MLLIIDDKIPFIRGEAEKLGDVIYLPGAKITAADVREADVLITRTRTLCNKALLEGSKVKFIATATIGYDHLDVDYLREAGIAWTNCPGCNATSVAQYVETSLLLLEQEGKVNLKDCTVGVVGVGNVGRRVVERLERMGCRVLQNDPPRAEREAEFSRLAASLRDLQEQCDVITIHTPLVNDGMHPTHHLVNSAFLQGLKRRPVLINAGRGEVVDGAALSAALDQDCVSAAVIDTWEGEPCIDRNLLQKVFLGTPHIAGYSADGKANGTRMALEAVAHYFNKEVSFDVSAPELPETYAYYPKMAVAPDSPLRFYNPLRDSEALKASPENFEKLRGDYPLRREP
ncbi:MAG: 4-phosphoerythronate dehydrogenase [Bacteroidaceae bacterium]|nr:4-phosphoerythronate dehydrogenase [Bacteroidaceae bacterium]